MGGDSSKENTYYFAREKKVMGEELLEFPMPMTPNVLTIEIEKLQNTYGGNFSIVEVKAVELASSLAVFPTGTYDFAQFAMRFSLKAGYLKSDFYVSKDENHVIWYKNNIDTSGTPAKINRRTGVVKVAVDRFRKYTIPMRVFILLHEYYHWRFATTDEVKADMSALRTYLQLQFPKSEANYAMTRIFPDTPFSRMRAQKMDEYIKATERSIF
jgi:hypothetical protein